MNTEPGSKTISDAALVNSVAIRKPAVRHILQRRENGSILTSCVKAIKRKEDARVPFPAPFRGGWIL